MGIEDFNDETISYIYGELTEEEEVNFEKKLSADPELAVEVERVKKDFDVIKTGVQFEKIFNDPGYGWAEKKAKEQLKKYQKKKRTDYLLSRKFRRHVLYPIAAGILAFVFLSNIVRIVINPDLVFQKFYKDFTNENYATATLNDAENIFQLCINDYNEGNYQDVAKNMHKLMDKGELNVWGSFLLGVYDGFTELTGTIWGEQIDPDNTGQDEATWYVALASFKLKDFETAQILLRKISSKNTQIGRRANQLRREISRLSRN